MCSTHQSLGVRGTRRQDRMKKILLLCFATLLATPGHTQPDPDSVRITIIRPSKRIPPDLKPLFGPPIYSPLKGDRLGPAVLDGMILPPKEFDHEYIGGRLLVTRTDEEGIAANCGRISQTGCAYFITGETCFVWIVDDYILDYQGYSYDAVFRHERAHCNGWRHANDRKQEK